MENETKPKIEPPSRAEQCLAAGYVLGLSLIPERHNLSPLDAYYLRLVTLALAHALDITCVSWDNLGAKPPPVDQ